MAHRAPDEAIFAAYGQAPDMPDEGLLSRSLELNLERAVAWAEPSIGGAGPG